MAARGHMPSTFEGHSIQATGVLRHGPGPVLGPTSNHHFLDAHSSVDLLERKMVMQASEMERLAVENQRLAATHGSLRQDLVATQQEMQRVQAHLQNVQAEDDFQTKGLGEQINKMEADLRAGESLRKELQEAHTEAKNLVASRKELSTEIQKLTSDLQKAHADLKNLPEMHNELESLRQDHQRLRASFEYEKGLNIEQVEQMHAMERNLVSLTRELQNLRSEVLHAEQRARVNNPYGGAYANSSIGYAHGGLPGGYMDGYGRPQVQLSGGVPVEGMSPYGGNGGAAASGGWGGPNEVGGGAPQPPQM